MILADDIVAAANDPFDAFGFDRLDCCKLAARRAVRRWGSLDALYLSVITGYTDHVLTPRLARILLDNFEQVMVSRELVRLDWQ